MEPFHINIDESHRYINFNAHYMTTIAVQRHVQHKPSKTCLLTKRFTLSPEWRGQERFAQWVKWIKIPRIYIFLVQKAILSAILPRALRDIHKVPSITVHRQSSPDWRKKKIKTVEQSFWLIQLFEKQGRLIGEAYPYYCSINVNEKGTTKLESSHILLA